MSMCMVRNGLRSRPRSIPGLCSGVRPGRLEGARELLLLTGVAVLLSMSAPAQGVTVMPCPDPRLEGAPSDLLDLPLAIDKNGRSFVLVETPSAELFVRPGMATETRLSVLMLSSDYPELDDPSRLGLAVGGEPDGPGGHGGGLFWPGHHLDAPTFDELFQLPPVEPEAPLWTIAAPAVGSPVCNGISFSGRTQATHHGLGASVWTAEGTAGQLIFYQEPVQGQFPTRHARIKLPSGTVMEFAPVHGTGLPTATRTAWQLKKIFDSHDNVTLFVHDTSGRLVRIEHPSGAREVWEWRSSCGAVDLTNLWRSGSG